MAFILGKQEDDDKNKQGGSASGGAFAGSLAPQSVQGSGGQQNWVNIQEYLNANPNGSNAQNLLENEYNPALQQDQSGLNSAKDDYLNKQGQTENQIGSLNDAQNRLGGLRQEYFDSRAGLNAAEQDPSKVNSLRSNESLINNATNLTLSNPGPFGYALSQKSRELPSQLNNQNYKQQINTLYNKAYDGFNTGQAALQEQLDQANPAIEQKRKELISKQGDLQNNLNNTTASLNDRYNTLNNNFNSSRESLKNGFGAYQDSVKGFDRLLNEKKYWAGGDEVNPQYADFSVKSAFDAIHDTNNRQYQAAGGHALDNKWNEIYKTLGNRFVGNQPYQPVKITKTRS